MHQLHEHHRLPLGLDSNWIVGDVELSLEGKRVEIRLEFIGSEVKCPECGEACGRHDLAPERTWRHLDTMQFETVLRARVPRCACRRCGLKRAAVPCVGGQALANCGSFTNSISPTNTSRASAIIGTTT